MRNFEYFTPTRVIFGKDTHLKIGTVLKEQNCSKVLIHYGSHSAVSSGLIDEIRSSLDEAGISYVTLGGVVPNPRLSKVREGIELCRKEQVDFLLAVGGGSVIDSCKAIGYGLANPDTDVWNFFLRTETPKACLPVGVILTIAASGSEMSGSCVITNEEGWLKRSSARNDLCRPRFAILNPRLTYTLPQYQTESGCVDILMHTMERYFVNIETMEITDSISESLMQTVIYNSRILMKETDNYTARAEIMWPAVFPTMDLPAAEPAVVTGPVTSWSMNWAAPTMWLTEPVLPLCGEAGHVTFMMQIRNALPSLQSISLTFPAVPTSTKLLLPA